MWHPISDEGCLGCGLQVVRPCDQLAPDWPASPTLTAFNIHRSFTLNLKMLPVQLSQAVTVAPLASMAITLKPFTGSKACAGKAAPWSAMTARMERSHFTTLLKKLVVEKLLLFRNP